MKYWLNLILIVSLLAAGPQRAFGQKMSKDMNMAAPGGPVLPLDSVLQRVERRNPAVQQYAYQARAKEAAVAGYNSWEAPKVSAGLWMTPYNQAKARELSGAGPNQLQGQAIVSVEQMIPNPAKQRARREYLSSQSAAVLADRQYRVVQLRAQAKTLYVEQAVLTKKLAVLDENEELLRFLIKLAEARYPYNQATLPSIYDAKARLEMHLNDHRQADALAAQNQIMLNTLMNRPRSEAFAVDTAVLNTAAHALAPVDTAALAGRRSDVRSLDRALTTVRLSQQLEASRRLPDFGVQFDHMPFLGTGANQFTLMGSVSLPLVPWAAREYRANTAALGFEAQALRKQREDVLNEASGRLASLQTDLTLRADQTRAFERRILPALRRSYQATMLAYEQNTGQLFQVLEAWTTLKRTRLEYLDNVQQQLTQQIAYEKELEQ
ncbi:TolC family protein [Hymenobacter guriensis]|uniref:TolC family protein n=1 Tax=Hymenobacter guriensis TaxID=2793065 RepID=A0ABS0L6U9_9BACT|nr:TolC family protein [Hymenobacter guriensis]MBG8555845.1 TolC family protein [Hymenobacter guriensis]